MAAPRKLAEAEALPEVTAPALEMWPRTGRLGPEPLPYNVIFSGMPSLSSCQQADAGTAHNKEGYHGTQRLLVERREAGTHGRSRVSWAPPWGPRHPDVVHSHSVILAEYGRPSVATAAPAIDAGIHGQYLGENCICTKRVQFKAKDFIIS